MPINRLFKLYLSSDREYARALTNILGFVPVNIHLYRLAFRHKSVAHEIKTGIKNSNERLEFLGDSILGAVVSDFLFKKYPYRPEGFLTEMRSKLVNRQHLNQLGKKLGLEGMIDYDGKAMGGNNKQGSMLGDAFEALVGAVYLDKGFDVTCDFLLNRIIKQHIDVDALELTETNFKSKLIEWCQRHGKEIYFEQVPETEASGRQKLFTVKVIIENEIIAEGQDFTKKNAEKIAAERACSALAI